MAAIYKRRWFQFSLRTLVIFTAIACLYFACWIPTKTRGVDGVARRYAWKYNGHAAANAEPVLPLLLRVTVDRSHRTGLAWTHARESAYCIWLFGIVIEAPYSSR
jgi:hypothetical protein